MSVWHLGIDFGTSYTVAAVATEGSVTVVDVESNGRSRMPSSVFMSPDGEILVGTNAQHQAVFAPERYEPTPKRSLGEGDLFLGDDLVPVTDLVAAVLRRVYTEASRQQGESAPDAVFVTHPADWGETRLDVLREAIEQADLSGYSLVAEPVAAAARIGLSATTPGQFVAVYDFGGGTFDAAVLRRTPEGFDVAGPPAGRDPLGGEDVDQRIIDYLGEVLSGDDPEKWALLDNPTDVNWRRNAAGLRTEVQRAKETLSEVSVCQLWVPGLERDIQLTRAELEKLIAADIDATVDALEQVLSDANTGAGDLAGIYMVGGSSRIPLVADTIWRRLGVRPAVQDNPKSVVAMGAAGWATLAEQAHAATARAATPSAAPTDAADIGQTSQPIQGSGSAGTAAGTHRSVLAASVGLTDWHEGSSCVAELTLDFQGLPPATIRARDEPSSGSVNELATKIGTFRSSRTPGYRETNLLQSTVFGAQGIERQFEMTSPQGPLPMFERYLILGERSFVIAGPEAAREIAETISLAPVSLDNTSWFEARFIVPELPGWIVSERLRLRRNGTGRGWVVDRIPLAPGIVAEHWIQQQFDALIAQEPGSTVVNRTKAPVLNHFAGEVLTSSWQKDSVRMLTKRGVAVSHGDGYVATISLPFSEQGQFSSLARQSRLHPEAPIAENSSA
jgi:actin-like ATPase involved in cell morphogenesis